MFQRAPSRLAHQREGLGQQVVERLAVASPLAQSRRRARAAHESWSSSISGSKRLIAATRFSKALKLARLAHAKRALEDLGHPISLATGQCPSGAAGARRGGPDRRPPRGSNHRRRVLAGHRAWAPAREARASRRRRRLSRWRLTWRARSSAHRLTEWARSREASCARSVTPFRCRVDLGDLGVGDRGVALLAQLDLQLGQLRDLARDLLEAPLDVLAHLLRHLHVASLDRDPHGHLLGSGSGH